MKAIDSMWFNTAQGAFGIVVGENDMGERKLYAGVVSGLDQQADEQAILSWGNKVNLGMMEGLIARTRKASTTEVLRKRFTEMANRWHDETDHLSSPEKITKNGLYLEIISMGAPVIPLILQDLQERGGQWYEALRKLSGADPVPTEVRGEVPKMNEAWLSWGRDKGYIEEEPPPTDYPPGTNAGLP